MCEIFSAFVSSKWTGTKKIEKREKYDGRAETDEIEIPIIFDDACKRK